MASLADSKYLFVFVYLWQVMAAIYRMIYWLLLQRTSRISRLAYQLEQLNAREQELSCELARLNEEYLARSAHIQARRTSAALERAKVLEQLAQTTEVRSGVSTFSIKTVPMVECAKPQEPKAVLKCKPAIAPEKVSKPKPKPIEVKPAIKRSVSLTVGQSPVVTRPLSPFLAARSSIFERPKTPEVMVRPKAPVITIEPRAASKVAPKKEETVAKVESVQQTNSSFSKLSGFNLATHRVNEYIDLMADAIINEFRSFDRELSPGSKRSQRFRAAIRELHGEPEWAPIINDIRQQHKIFCYL